MKSLVLIIGSLILFYNLSFSQIKVHSSGKVKIGATTDPSAILDIKGNTYSSWFYYGTNEDTYIRPGKSTGSVIMDYGNVGIGVAPSAKLDIKGSTYTSYFYSGTNEDTYIRPGKSTGNVVFDYGKVGIGISAPSSLLNIHGATPNLEISNTSETEAGILFYDHGYESTQYGEIGFNCSTNSLNFYCNYSTPTFSIYPSRQAIFYGDFNINANSYTGGIKSEQLAFFEFNLPTFYPNTHWGAVLGTSSKLFAGAYIDHIWYNDLTDLSDARIKENITEIENVLNKIQDLRPVRFDIKPDFFDSIPADARQTVIDLHKNNIGFIAQEVKEIFPDLVEEIPGSDLYGINTVDLIPLLVKSIQEQQNMIDDLKEQINQLKSDSSIFKSELSINSIGNLNSSLTNCILYQNNPNPFNVDTEIRFKLPDEVRNSIINIYDLQGKQIKSFNIEERGEAFITINRYELEPGIYLYTLIADGQEIGTKRMILTD